MLKYRKGMLMTGAAVVLLPFIALFLRGAVGLAQTQPDIVAINILGSTVQSGSNIVTFMITNAFEFPIRYAVAVLTKQGTETWRAINISEGSITLRRGQIAARSAITVDWALPPTNRWRMEVPYNDPHSPIVKDARSPFGRRKVEGVVHSPEMIGGSSVTPVK